MVSARSSPLDAPTAPSFGGLTVYLSALCRELARHCDVDVFAPGDPSIVTTAAGVRVIHVAEGSADAFVDRIGAEHSERPYDLLHAHYWTSAVSGLRVRSQLGLPWVQTFHTVEAMKGVNPDPVRVSIEDETARICDLVICSTARERAALEARVPSHTSRFAVVRPGVDREVFPASPARPGPILYVGRADPLKGLDILLEAVRLARGTIALDVVGAGSPSSDFARSVCAEAASLPVRFFDPTCQRKLAAHFQRAAAVVMPARYESFGLVGLEAMASARVCISTVDAGISEVLGTGLGVVVPSTARALADAIVAVAGDAGRADALGRRASRAAGSLTWRESARRSYGLYRELVYARRARSAPGPDALRCDAAW
jgi:D-inositol-3-phosphate glycosyltransferase